MKIYTLKDTETGLFYRGQRGWSKRPRVFTNIGFLRNSIRQNRDQFIELKDMTYHNFILFMGTHGGFIEALPSRYQVQEIEL